MHRELIFCGGGSGGHVLPALTLIREVSTHYPKTKIFCVGSYDGIEAKIFRKNKFNYKAISTGKLRRYFSWKNFIDIFKILRGLAQSYYFLLKFPKKDCVIVATGGFVTVPVVIAGWLQRKKIVIHEQTTRAGLANRICSVFADKVLLTFEDSLAFFPKNKSKCIGYPLRNEIFNNCEGLIIKGIELDKLDRKIIFVTGGGNGSTLLNEVLEESLSELSDRYFIIHQCGSKFYNEYIKYEKPHYKVFDFIDEQMIPLLKKADIVISRSGAGTVVELMALNKASIFIPLKIAQRNEQYFNAKAASDKLGSIIIEEDHLTKKTLLQAIDELHVESLPDLSCSDNPTTKILEEISST